MTDTTIPPLPPLRPIPMAHTITTAGSATTTTPAATDNYQRLHQLIADFTKRELKEVLKEFHWRLGGKNRGIVLSWVQQLIDGRDVDVDRLSLVVNDIHERNNWRRLSRKRSSDNGHTNGHPKRPQSGNCLLIVTPTPIIICPPPLSPIANRFDTNLSDNSGQEVVTDCAFRRLPKYTIVKQLREPQMLTSISDREIRKYFTLSVEYFPDMYSNLTEILTKNQMQIQLRLSRTAEPAAEDSVPEGLCIDVNDTRVYTHSDDGQQRCRPYDVSQYCRLGLNNIHFFLSTAKSEYLLTTLFEVSIVTEQTDQSFVEYLIADSGNRWTADETKALIRGKFRHNLGDDGICVLEDSIQVSLMCPVSRRRLRIPCRTVKCQHIECFDGQSFFAVNELRSEWLCPICQSPADTSHIRVDTYFETVLVETSESVTTIRVKSDGNYVICGRFDGQVIQLLNNEEVMASTGDSDDNDCIVLHEKYITIT